jgi:hypothetical protein
MLHNPTTVSAPNSEAKQGAQMLQNSAYGPPLAATRSRREFYKTVDVAQRQSGYMQCLLYMLATTRGNKFNIGRARFCWLLQQ